MSEKLIGSCIFGQSGGPTAVINASAYGVIRAALDAEEITKVYGANHGIKGVLDDKLFVMDEEDPELTTLITSVFSRSSRNIMCATSSIMAATTPWTPAIKSAAIWNPSAIPAM